MHVQTGLNTHINNNNNNNKQIDNVLTIKLKTKKNTNNSKNEKLEINELIYW